MGGGRGGETKIFFLANVPSVGFAVYEVEPAASAPSASSLKVTDYSLENDRYRVQLDRELAMSPASSTSPSTRNCSPSPLRLAFQTENPHDWPAWNMDWKRPAEAAARLRSGSGHRFASWRTVRFEWPSKSPASPKARDSSRPFDLSSGDAGNRLEFSNAIDWRTGSAALKAVFPLTAANPQATYNWDVGTIQRGNNDPKKYEVPSHQWFDLTDQSGAYGITVLSDCKYGSDKPDDNTLRLTLIYTPGLGGGNGKDYSDQTTQDWGHHEFIYRHRRPLRRLASRNKRIGRRLRLNQPLIAFESPRHPGTLGRSFSLLRVSNSRVRVLALKKAEASDEIIVRLVEMSGKLAAKCSSLIPGSDSIRARTGWPGDGSIQRHNRKRRTADRFQSLPASHLLRKTFRALFKNFSASVAGRPTFVRPDSCKRRRRQITRWVR